MYATFSTLVGTRRDPGAGKLPLDTQRHSRTKEGEEYDNETCFDRRIRLDEVKSHVGCQC